MTDASGVSGLPRWAIPLLCVLLGVVCGLGYTRLASPSYTASAFVVVTAQPPSGDRRDVSLAQALGRLVDQQEVVTAAGAAMGLRPDQVIKSVQGRTSPDAPIIEIIGTAPTAARSAELVNAVANGLVTFAGGKMAATGVTLSVLSVATPPAAPSSPSLVLDLAVGAGAGILLGALYLLATGGMRRKQAPVRSTPASLPGAVSPDTPRPPPPPNPGYPPPPGGGRRPYAPGPPPRRPPGGPGNRPGPPSGGPPPHAAVPPPRSGRGLR